MNKELKKRLEAILTKMVRGLPLELHELRFLRARASYLSAEQLKQLNGMIKSVPGLNVVKKKDIQDLTKSEDVVVEVEPVPSKEVVTDEAEDEDDLPEDSGELEVVDDEGEEVALDSADETDTQDEADEEFDIDEMNLEQLKSVAKDLGISNTHLFKSEKSLREKILATYETSDEAAAESTDEVEDEVVDSEESEVL